MAKKRRGNAYLIKFRGKTRSLSEWSRITGINRTTIRHRLKNCGWSAKRALTEKPRPMDNSQRGSGLSAAESRRRRRAARRKKGLCIECGVPAGGFAACEECRKKRSDYVRNNKPNFQKLRRKYIQKQKRQVFEHYGMSCECCGESEIAFLALDHPNDDGTKHRTELGRAGSSLYHWLIQNNFPEDYALRTLCFNCNQGRRVNGGVCPHQEQQA